MAQFRDLEAFAQFGSELDKASQQQLNRGRRLVEILKQKQYVPMSMEKQVLIVYAGVKGFVDDLPVDSLAAFEAECEESKTLTGDNFELVFQINSLNLATGYYSFDFALLDTNTLQFILKAHDLFSTSIIARFDHGGFVNMDAQLSLCRLDSGVQP